MSSSSSPGSSSPLRPADTPDEVSKPSKKRSHDNIEADSEPSSSVTMAGDNSSTNGERRASTADAQAAKPSMQAHTTTTMGPPPPPASNQSLASQKAPPSCQGSGKPPETTSDKGEPAKIAPTQIPDSSHDTYHSATQGTDTREDTDPLSPSEMSDPSERIEDFDWENHETRYHKKMDEFRNSENEIIDEFQSLCQVSAVDF